MYVLNDFRKMKILFWYLFSIILINAFCWIFMKFVNEEANPHLGKSPPPPTIWPNSLLIIRQTLMPTQANPVENGSNPNFKEGEEWTLWQKSCKVFNTVSCLWFYGHHFIVLDSKPIIAENQLASLPGSICFFK